MDSISLEDMTNELIGPKGSLEREEFDRKVAFDLMLIYKYQTMKFTEKQLFAIRKIDEVEDYVNVHGIIPRSDVPAAQVYIDFLHYQEDRDLAGAYHHMADIGSEQPGKDWVMHALMTEEEWASMPVNDEWRKVKPFVDRLKVLIVEKGDFDDLYNYVDMV